MTGSVLQVKPKVFSSAFTSQQMLKNFFSKLITKLLPDMNGMGGGGNPGFWNVIIMGPVFMGIANN